MPRGIMKWDIGRVDSSTTKIKCTRVIRISRHGFEWVKDEQTAKSEAKKKKKW